MIYPEAIKTNEIIGVTATSGGLEEQKDLNKLESAIKNINNLGFKVLETPNVRMNDKLVSSSKEKRAKEFMDLWLNDDVKSIILARGGEFLMEILPYLDEEMLLNKSPKWVQGFSDSSVLLFYLTTNFDISTIHAENFSSYGMVKPYSSLITTINFLKDPLKELKQISFERYEKERVRWQEGKELEPYNLTEKVEYHNLYDSSNEMFEGRLIGGCIDVLRALVGTRFDKTKEFCKKFSEGMLWYLENCELSVTELYRALWQMKMAGWFDNSNAFLIGRTMSRENIGDYSYEDVLHDVFDDMNVKVVYDVDFGHVAPQWTMVNGSFAKFEYNLGKGTLISLLK